jgi:hypothetical protein
MREKLRLKGVEHEARLNASESLPGIDLERAIHVLGKIQDDGHIAALAGKTGSRAAGQHGGAKLPTGTYGRDYVIGIARNDEAYRHLAIVGSIRRIKSPAAPVETDFAANLPLEGRLQSGGLREAIDRFSVRAGRQR